MNKAIIVGACSAIAHEFSKLLALEGYQIALLARSKDKLEVLKQDLLTRGSSQVYCIEFDALNDSQSEGAFAEAVQKLGDPSLVLIAHGTLPNQSETQNSVSALKDALQVNFLSTALLLNLAANHFETKEQGQIIVISSVAGDRGRKSNYTYGAAKAGLSAFVSGVRNRLASSGINVLLVKPGFVATPMTAHLKKGPLFVSPKQVAKDIFKAAKNKSDTIYTPWFWRVIMLVITSIPERIFKRLSL